MSTRSRLPAALDAHVEDGGASVADDLDLGRRAEVVRACTCTSRTWFVGAVGAELSVGREHDHERRAEHRQLRSCEASSSHAVACSIARGDADRGERSRSDASRCNGRICERTRAIRQRSFRSGARSDGSRRLEGLARRLRARAPRREVAPQFGDVEQSDLAFLILLGMERHDARRRRDAGLRRVLAHEARCRRRGLRSTRQLSW